MDERRDSGEPRTVLGDLTNRVGKRGLFVREKNEIAVSDSDDKDVVKRVRVSASPSSDISSLIGNVVLPGENREPDLLNFVNSFDVPADCGGGGNSKAHAGNNNEKILGLEENVEVVDEDKCPALENAVVKAEIGPKIIGCGEENDPKRFDLIETRVSGNDCEENVSVEGSQSDYHNDVDDNNNNNIADNFMLSQSGSIDCTMQSELVKEDDSYMSSKDCSCSFCTKAAYMWLDLNYQDMKARLSVMKKSQKDASMLAERSSRINFPEKNGSESSTRTSKLESHLMYQWRSLFQRTSEIWKIEGNQLEASLLPLTGQREKCKTELESKMAGKH